jgi:radical SAM-linked protein
MSNTRLLIKKDGLGKYISHLDLMHTMERVFNRAGIKIWHTQGFNPHPYMSFCMPLSVGVESICEIMDFVLDDDTPLDGLTQRLNEFLPAGVQVLEAYSSERKTKEIVWLEIAGQYIYDDATAEEKCLLLKELYSRESIVIERRTKRGFGNADIAENIKNIELSVKNEHTVALHGIIAAQNPSLNPEHLVTAIKQLMPENTPDFHFFRRIEVYDGDMKVFR